MDAKDIIGHFVLLDEKFIETAHNDVDENVPIKTKRPYLIVEIEDKNRKTQLFAVPFQTNIDDATPNDFFEKLPRRLETRRGCYCGLFYSQIVPITAAQVIGKKGADTYIPNDPEKRNIVLETLWFRSESAMPANARPSFNYLKKQAIGYGLSAFNNKQFQQSYKIVARAIFDETIKVKDEKLAVITQKTKNYIQNYYLPFLRQKVYNKGNNDSKDKIKMPARFTQLNKLGRFLNKYNTKR